jgi:hypothetical protein
MRKLLLCLAVAMTAATASAQEATKPFIGVGATVNTNQGYISVPLNLSPVFRLEPFIGLDYHRETDRTSPLGDVITTNREFDLGVGAFFLQDMGSQVELIAGGKIELGFVKDQVEDKASNVTVSDSFTGFGIAAVGGAEYYFSPRFALGVEAELGLRTAEAVTDVRDTFVYTATFVTAKAFFK